MSNFILGGGISGLIWKFYNPEFEIITPIQTIPNTDIQVGDPFVRSKMIWLHDAPQTRQLLLDLGWQEKDIKTRKSSIGYYDRGVIRELLTPRLKQVLVDKKMTDWRDSSKIEAVQQAKDGDSPRLSLTTGIDKTNFMNVLDVDHGAIMWRLKKKCEMTHGFVGEIRDSQIGVTNTPPNKDSQYVYQRFDHIISTIPAPFFWRAWLAGHPAYPIDKFESLPVTFVITKKKPDFFDDRFEMCYYDGSTTFTRVSNLENKYCIEFTGNLSKEEFQSMFPEYPVRDIWTLPQGRIRSLPTLPPKGITFSGRFAEWQHSITTEAVVKDAMDFARNKGEKK